MKIYINKQRSPWIEQGLHECNDPNGIACSCQHFSSPDCASPSVGLLFRLKGHHRFDCITPVPKNLLMDCVSYLVFKLRWELAEGTPPESSLFDSDWILRTLSLSSREFERSQSSRININPSYQSGQQHSTSQPYQSGQKPVVAVVISISYINQFNPLSQWVTGVYCLCWFADPTDRATRKSCERSNYHARLMRPPALVGQTPVKRTRLILWWQQNRARDPPPGGNASLPHRLLGFRNLCQKLRH